MVTVTAGLSEGSEKVCASASEGNKQTAINARFRINGRKRFLPFGTRTIAARA